ncbi:Hsp20/alpha crystallin family protein [Haloprofundus salilacus]|uniref:Hsp20/alpha crystallin family protein n=1 Tax=Haloprofundus salilacus TaxID=2876190 RepID=UPI003CCCA149
MNDLREIGESVANAVVERVGRGFGHVQERKPLSYDLLESDDSYLVVFDAAGASKSDVQVRFVDTEVQVRIDRFREFHDGYEMRFPGRGLSLDGKAKLPNDATVDAESATATVTKHGTLRVYIPKAEEGKNVAVEEETAATGVDARATGGETNVVEEKPTEEEAKEAATAQSADESDAAGTDDTDDEDDASAAGTDATASTESMLDEEAAAEDPDARLEPAEAAGQPTDESMDEIDDEFVEQAEARDEDEDDENRN